MISGGSSVVYYAIGGQYSYSWFENQGVRNVTIGSSNFYIGQSNLTFSLPISSFSNVTFSETNLPAGTTWFVRQVSGPDASGSYNQTSGSTIKIEAMKGINTFVAGYLADGSSINLTYISVDFGSESDVSLNFPPLYSASISATNLPNPPAFKAWGINASFYYGSFSDSFHETVSGSQTFSVLVPAVNLVEDPFMQMNSSSAGSSSYFIQLPQDHLQINQNNESQSIRLGTLYNVTIKFAGMPASDYLSLQSVSGNITSLSSSQSIDYLSILAPNGTYGFNYGVGSSPQTASSMSVPFSFNVSGSDMIFNLEIYNVTFSSYVGIMQVRDIH